MGHASELQNTSAHSIHPPSPRFKSGQSGMSRLVLGMEREDQLRGSEQLKAGANINSSE